MGARLGLLQGVVAGLAVDPVGMLAGEPESVPLFGDVVLEILDQIVVDAGVPQRDIAAIGFDETPVQTQIRCQGVVDGGSQLASFLVLNVAQDDLAGRVDDVVLQHLLDPLHILVMGVQAQTLLGQQRT